MAIATSTLAAIGIAGALGYKARRGANAPANIPAPPTIPTQPKTPDPLTTFSTAIQRQKLRATGSQGRNSTLLTGPMGDSGSGTQRKTLLGS